MARPFAYITSAWSADKRDAKEEAVLCCRKLYEAGYTPVCPVLSMNEYLHRETAEEHKDMQDMAAEMLRRSRILVVCGKEMSEQVKNDIALAKRAGVAATTLEGILTLEGQTKKRR